MKGKKEKEGALSCSFKAEIRLPRAVREGKGCAQAAVRAAGRAGRPAPAPGQRQPARRIGQGGTHGQQQGGEGRQHGESRQQGQGR